MNIKLIQTIDLNLIRSIITTPKLFETQIGQSDTVESYIVDINYDYFLIINEDEILGLFQTRPFTKICLEAHIHLLPKYWGKRAYSKYAIKSLFEHFKSSEYNIVLTDVPEECSHVINLLLKLDCEVSGFIPQSVIYNNKLMGLFLFSHSLKRNN